MTGLDFSFFFFSFSIDGFFPLCSFREDSGYDSVRRVRVTPRDHLSTTTMATTTTTKDDEEEKDYG